MSTSTPAPDSPAKQPAATPPAAPWGALIPDEQWDTFLHGARALESAGVPFVLHGAFALATYTGRWRNTKDVDVVVREEHRDAAVAALRSVGFADYFEQQAYDRSWIFRGFKDGVIFDVIWELPNHRVMIDEEWFERAQPLMLRGRLFASAPVEELIRVKLYVFQRERCDWVDVLNVTAATVDRIDWRYLVNRVGRDLPLLHGMLAVFNWLSPHRAQRLPTWVREQFALARIEADDTATMEVRRAAILDSRPWFALHQPADRVLER